MPPLSRSDQRARGSFASRSMSRPPSEASKKASQSMGGPSCAMKLCAPRLNPSSSSGVQFLPALRCQRKLALQHQLPKLFNAQQRHHSGTTRCSNARIMQATVHSGCESRLSGASRCANYAQHSQKAVKCHHHHLAGQPRCTMQPVTMRAAPNVSPD